MTYFTYKMVHSNLHLPILPKQTTKIILGVQIEQFLQIVLVIPYFIHAQEVEAIKTLSYSYSSDVLE